jgi:hypothetical protein
MVFTDQMIRPRRVVLQMPKDLKPPRVNLAFGFKVRENKARVALPSSPLGVWYLDGCETFLETIENVLAYSPPEDDDFYRKVGRLVEVGEVQGNFTHARGRSNLNIKAVPPIGDAKFESTTAKTKSECDEIKMVHKLQDQASNIATMVSGRMEVWLDLPKGSMANAHKEGKSSSLRLLDYPTGVSVPPHTDGSAYTIVYNNCAMLIQSPDDDGLWYEIPANKDSGQLLLMLGSHLDQAIPKRLEQIGLGDSASDKLRAPIHRLSASVKPRRALTLHIKADTAWPLALEELNQSNHKVDSEGVLTADDYHERDIAWDAELFSQYLCDKCVPSVEDVQHHFTLLASLVKGHDARKYEDDNKCSTSGNDLSSFPEYHLPSVHYTGYWQLQTKRYCMFLQIHQHRPSEASGMLPPREIHHVWLCHQLHPLCYKTDCKKLLGGILDHKNSKFCLDGCPKFHKLWQSETGACWPSQADMSQEADMAIDLPEMTANHDDLSMISANLWHNYDSLSRLYFDLKKEAPDLFALHSGRETSFLDNTRLEYARFLVAASYAATVGMMITPSGPIDLVWHTHQTDPKAYEDTIHREFSTGPIDHIPCGALSTPSAEVGKEWLEMTDKIWIKLYGEGVNVQGQAIHCCTPTNPRPERAVLTNSMLAWWFPLPLPGESDSCVKNFDGFPTTTQDLKTCSYTVVQNGPRRFTLKLNRVSLFASILQRADLMNTVMTNVFQPLLKAMRRTLLTHKDDIKKIKSNNVYIFRSSLLPLSNIFFICIFSSPCNAFIRTILDDAKYLWLWFFSTFVLCPGLICYCHSFHAKNIKLLEQCKEKFWSQIRGLVVSFNSQAAECNMRIEFQEQLEGPNDPSHTENDRYKGPAIVFHVVSGADGRDGDVQPGAEEEGGSTQQPGEQEQVYSRVANEWKRWCEQSGIKSDTITPENLEPASDTTQAGAEEEGESTQQSNEEEKEVEDTEVVS